MLGILNEWISISSITEVDWKNRSKDLDFQDMVRVRDELAQRLSSYAQCKECPDFRQHVRPLSSLDASPLNNA